MVAWTGCGLFLDWRSVSRLLTAARGIVLIMLIKFSFVESISDPF